MKQQLTNAQKYKDVIREEKDLTKLVGTESNFDVDSALRTMLTYYECWQGHDPRLIDRISIADEEITQHLKTELVQDRTAPLMSIQIDNFPNEEGYFMLWELSISEKESGKRILPIFVNSAMVLRPMAGKRIFLRLKMYAQKNVELYLRDLYECALNQAKSVEDYKAWFDLAEKKAKIDVTAAEHNVDIDTSELNRAFCVYAIKNFGKLSSEINPESPVMVSSVMDYIHDHSEKAAFMAYAVMNIDDSGYYSFQELNDSVYLFPFKYHVEKETIVSDSRFSISTFGSELSISLT